MGSVFLICFTTIVCSLLSLVGIKLIKQGFNCNNDEYKYIKKQDIVVSKEDLNIFINHHFR